MVLQEAVNQQLSVIPFFLSILFIIADINYGCFDDVEHWYDALAEG